MKWKWVRRALLIFFSLVFLVCAGWLAVILAGYARSEALHNAVRDEVFTLPEASQAPQSPEDPEEESPAASPGEEEGEEELVLPTVDFEALQAINGDIIGWIWIPDTVVSYPILLGENNQTYISTAYDGSYSASGSIFLEYRGATDFTGLNSILYGHHMRNGSMFSALMHYRGQDYADSHPDVYIFTPGCTRIYRVFSAYVTQSDSDAYTYDFAGSQSFQDWMEAAARRSAITPPGEYQANSSDPVLTLSTCTTVTETQRMVVHAQLTQTIGTDGT